MEPSRYAVVLDEARRALDQQAHDVARIRERTTSLVLLGSLAAAFIGGLALRDDAALSGWSISGAVAFAALLAVAVFALWPRRFVFTQHAQLLVYWAELPDMTREKMERNLALFMDRHYRGNAKRLDRLTILYGIGLALLILEIVLLLLDLRGR